MAVDEVKELEGENVAGVVGRPSLALAPTPSHEQTAPRRNGGHRRAMGDWPRPPRAEDSWANGNCVASGLARSTRRITGRRAELQRRQRETLEALDWMLGVEYRPRSLESLGGADAVLERRHRRGP